MGTKEPIYFEYGTEEIEYLKSADPIMGEVITRIGTVKRVVIPDLFAALMNAMVSQLVSTKAAQTIWDRMQERFGEITPENMSKQPADAIQQCGMTMKKAVYIQNAARMVQEGVLDLQALDEQSDDEVVQSLSSLPGVGRWTAEMLLIHSMQRRDVVSWGDLAIRRGMMKLYELPDLTKKQFETYRQRYSPYGTIASFYLWAVAAE
ncbi:DNA-3-methyladenine glycosylase family protein [Marinicrinis lubricantis]|uniref:DNA-3-methyladenine glycosylase II n=1 Tax=Marinicrinis lubricantis TaxID=2086470 RepID=A0ABW1IPJ6_9BACL